MEEEEEEKEEEEEGGGGAEAEREVVPLAPISSWNLEFRLSQSPALEHDCL